VRDHRHRWQVPSRRRDEGKRLIQRLVEFSQEPEVRKRIVFLPNYDIAMAQLLLSGHGCLAEQPAAPASRPPQAPPA
jgi:glucan phosphorylase